MAYCEEVFNLMYYLCILRLKTSGVLISLVKFCELCIKRVENGN